MQWSPQRPNAPTMTHLARVAIRVVSMSIPNEVIALFGHRDGLATDEIAEAVREAFADAEALGYKLVPREPTQAITEVGMEHLDAGEWYVGEWMCQEAWRAMWDAA